MSAQNELERLRRLLNMAETEITEGRPDAALELLRPVISSIESHEGTVEWAELPLVVGHALTAKKKEEALTYLNDALRRIQELHDPPLELKIRVQKYLGNFYRLCARRRASARECYVKAKLLADEVGFVGDSDKLQLRICGIDLENDDDPLLADFAMLVGVGRQEGFTAREQLDVWDEYRSKMANMGKNLKAGRMFGGGASAKYFFNLLRSKRNERSTQ